MRREGCAARVEVPHGKTGERVKAETSKRSNVPATDMDQKKAKLTRQSVRQNAALPQLQGRAPLIGCVVDEHLA